MDAEAWLTLIEKCFRVMRCLEHRNVELAIFLLQIGAEDWWRITESRRGATGDISWDDLKRHSLISSIHDPKQSEFLKLT